MREMLDAEVVCAALLVVVLSQGAPIKRPYRHPPHGGRPADPPSTDVRAYNLLMNSLECALVCV